MIKDRPTISIVTPSYNQGRFLEDTLQSVISQKYPRLEYVVMDGGSTDGSVALIQKYEDRLAYWTSERDGGQYDAINKGFGKTTGEIMGWLNSDDKYTPWAFDVVSDIFASLPELEWISTVYPLWIDEEGRVVRCYRLDGFSRQGFNRGEYLEGRGWHFKGYIQQESTFWRRSLWERAGGYVDTSLKYAGDFELWARFYKHAELYGVTAPLAGWRAHNDQKTAHYLESYVREATEVLRRHGGEPPGMLESFLRWKLLVQIPYLRRLAKKCGVIYSHRLCEHTGRNGGWKLVTR